MYLLNRCTQGHSLKTQNVCRLYKSWTSCLKLQLRGGFITSIWIPQRQADIQIVDAFVLLCWRFLRVCHSTFHQNAVKKRDIPEQSIKKSQLRHVSLLCYWFASPYDALNNTTLNTERTLRTFQCACDPVFVFCIVTVNKHNSSLSLLLKGN